MSGPIIFPGTFDPITYGHVDVICRAVAQFGDVLITIAENTRKTPLFDVKTRQRLIQEVFQSTPGVRVEIFSGVLVNFARAQGASLILRGVRSAEDVAYECQLAQMNAELAPGLETIFLVPRKEFFFISSTLVKELALLGQDVARFVPGPVALALQQRLAGGGGVS